MEREQLMGKCLYNGIELEELPVLAHSFAFIWSSGEDYVLEAVSEEPVTYLGDDGQHYVSFTDGDRYSNNYLAEDKWNAVTRSEGTAVVPASWVVWSNFDILNADGTVYMAASEPVAVAEKFPYRVFLDHFLAALAGRVRPVVRREPVAYLYNGVRLSALPEHDNNEHPHVVIAIYDLSIGLLGDDSAVAYFLSDIKVTNDLYDANTYKDFVWYSPGDKEVKATRPYDSTGDFTEFGEVSELSESKKFALENIIWTNTDLYNTDGTLYLAASDPVPVYE